MKELVAKINAEFETFAETESLIDKGVKACQERVSQLWKWKNY
jgi:hypothetical protein